MSLSAGGLYWETSLVDLEDDQFHEIMAINTGTYLREFGVR